ncbi:MDM31 Mitochondrial distribution and morphology protein 31 [Candida maltosa Xu316]
MLSKRSFLLCRNLNKRILLNGKITQTLIRPSLLYQQPIRLLTRSSTLFNESNKNKNESELLPTKEQLLSRANNVLSRLRIQLKWLLKKSNRPFNTDDYSAFFSWIVVGNVFMFFVATTTFVSIIIFLANTVFAQEFVARKLGEFITKNSNLTVTFESAIVPGWADGRISFRKCFVSRRPKKIEKFIKGSQQQAYEESLHNEPVTEDEEDIFEDDGNYTQFDLTIEEVNISLSFNKWVNGTGMIEDLEVKGMRGVVDRTHVHWDPDDDATNYKNVYRPGDFEFESFRMEDVLFTLMQPNGFRVFDVAIYNCELSKLRKHWLFYDFLNANVMSGAYDNSLFTIHKKQRLNDFDKNSPPSNDDMQKWKRVTRMRVDSLSIDHLNTGLEGPFGWITNGRVDMIGDVMVPEENDEITVSEIVTMIGDAIKKEATRYKNPEVQEKHPDMKTRLTSDDYRDISKYFVLDLTLRLKNVRATVPFKAPELSYINYALIRPIVAYINSKNNFIEIHNRIVKNLQDFSGSWTVYDSLLMDDISEEVYDNFADYVADEESRLIRMRRIGFWSLQLFLQLLLIGVGAIA